MTQKWNLQDIRPAQPRDRRPSEMPARLEGTRPTLNRTVRPPERSPHREISETESETGDENDGRIPVINGKKKSRGQIITGIVIAALVIGTGISISALTGGATVTLQPKVREFNVNAEFTAYSEPRPGELSYEIMTLEATDESQVKASGQETVTAQATGEIEISKSTPGAERLIKNTRFQTADGLVFRIQESVVVPGAGKDASGTTVPGTIRAQVFADEAGVKHNIPSGTPLNVPGFKEGGFTDLYNAITAKNTTAFTNGFNGPKFIIEETELSKARQQLQLNLRNQLLAKVATDRPADFTTFDSAIAITYTELPPVQSGDDLVTIREQAILQIPLFKKTDFASFLAKETDVAYDGDAVRVDNLSNLTFSYLSATTSQNNIANLPSLSFKIAGVPKIVSTVDAERMKAELLGMEKTALQGVLSKYNGIERGEVEVRPFWKRSFPTTLNEIVIEERFAGESETRPLSK